MLLVCVFFMFVCVTQGLTGSGFFCRDPDTGKLHAVNTSWASTTFCGNYHCKIRRKNISDTVYAPFRLSKVAQVRIDSQKSTTPTPSRTTELKTAKTNNNKILTADESDRYLTETEIKSLSEILYKVRKSDLDAIIEIYSLAKDILNEVEDKNIDGTTILDNLKRVYDTDAPLTYFKSYWYEPLHKSQSQPFNVKNIKNKDNNIYSRKDVNKDVTFTNNAKLESTKPNMIKETPTIAYFNGPLNNEDFRKLPYYYSISNFQRFSSYIVAPKINTIPKMQGQSSTQTATITPTPSPPNLIPNVYQKDGIPGPISLPYPYLSIPHNDNTDNNNVKNIIENVEKDPSNIILQDQENAILINPDLEDNMEDIEIKQQFSSDVDDLSKPLAESQEVVYLRPKWQTDPLSKDVLDEVRAFINEKTFLKPFSFPLRKMIKLERVGKVFDLDELTRKKRSSIETDVKPTVPDKPLESDLLEVYLDKTICQADITLPGYFRYGNTSQPYPACCPQRM